MVSVKLLKDPGFIYDLNFIFYLKFNFKSYIESLPDDDQKARRKAFFETVRGEFGDIPDDLYVFYHALENGKTFITTSYVVPYNELFSSEFNFNFFLGKLQDSDALIRNLIRFYLYDLSEEEIDLCANSQPELFARIKDSGYNDEEKNKLYEFFVNPMPSIQCLYSQLMEKEVRLSLYYEKNYQKIFDVFNKTTFQALSEQVKGLEDLDFLGDNNQILSTSYCLLNKFFLTSFAVKTGVIYLLGYDYASMIDFVKEKHQEPTMAQFASAFSEETRLILLKHLLQQNECTCKQFEKALNFSPSTVYHHITLLTKSGIVKTRNKGKIIYYSINRSYVDAAIKMLQNFSTRRERKEI